MLVIVCGVTTTIHSAPAEMRLPRTLTRRSAGLDQLHQGPYPMDPPRDPSDNCSSLREEAERFAKDLLERGVG